MSPSALITAISPVLLSLFFGYGAGKRGSLNLNHAKGLSRLALHYALPAALFLAMAHFSRSLLLEQGPIVAIMLIGYSGLYLTLFWILRALGMDRLKAALLGYTFVSTAVPIYGLTVLAPLYGEQVATGIVGLAALITNLAQVSVAVFLLESASTKSAAPSVLASLGRCAANPLVWAPVAGALVALFGLPLSPSISNALKPLAVSASGVAIFASGLNLAARRIDLRSPTVIVGSLIVLVVHPAIFFFMIKLAGVSGAMAHAAFVASTMPTSTPTVLFAQQYETCEAETGGIMLATTVGMLVALPASLALSAWL